MANWAPLAWATELWKITKEHGYPGEPADGDPTKLDEAYGRQGAAALNLRFR